MIWPWLVLLVLGIALFVFPYTIYPWVLGWRRARFAVGQTATPAKWPTVSVIVAAFNAEDRIGSKVQELLRLEYPGSFEVVVVDDGSGDRTAIRAKAAGAHQVLRLEERSGKSEAQNAGVNLATGEVLVFTDVSVIVRENALRQLIPALLVEGVGCVTGVDVSQAGESGDPAKEAGLYTRFEIALRRREAEAGTLFGVNGCLFAIRKAHRAPVPRECVDDLYVPLAVLDRGLRVALQPKAEAVVFRPQSLAEEYRRKVRTFAGGLFTLRRAADELPRAYARLRWRLLGHKWLRWLGPFFLLLAVYASIGLAVRWPAGWLLVLGEASCLLAGLIGTIRTRQGRKTPRLVGLAAFVLWVQVALLHAWWRLVTDRPFVVWRPTQRGL